MSLFNAACAGCGTYYPDYSKVPPIWFHLHHQVSAHDSLKLFPAGHYVVVCGYNADTDSFILQDPAAGCCNITVTSATFDSARKAWGTDEDLLIVPLAGRQVSATDVQKVQVYGKTSLCERCCRRTGAAPAV